MWLQEPRALALGSLLLALCPQCSGSHLPSLVQESPPAPPKGLVPVAKNHAARPVFIEDPEHAATTLFHGLGKDSTREFCPLPRRLANL